MKRVISFLLVCCTLVIALVACGGGGEKNTGTQKAPETKRATDIYGQDALLSDTAWEELDFEGEQLTILVRNDYKVSREWEVQDVGDDELELAITNRNEVVESNLNVDVRVKLCASEWHKDWLADFSTYISQDLDNKLHEYDMAANFGYSGMRIAFRDYFANLLDEDTFPHFDFSLACWNKSIIENGTVNGQLYLCAGDMNLSMFDSSMIIWHNMDLYDKLKKEGDPEDIQDVVLSGEWTYAELYKWASYFADAGDDSECADIYGVSIQGKTYPEQPGDAIPYAWGLDFVTTNADGTHSYNFIGNTKAEQALVDFRNLYGAGGNSWHVFSEAKTDKCTCGTGGHFVSGGILFKGDVIFWSKAGNNAIREMEDKYALLCWPKYDEGQTYYQTTSQDYFTTVSVLDHAESSIPTKGDAISAYLQYGTEYSYTHVRGYYFERIIKPKFFGTDDSDGHVTKSVTIFVNIIENLGYEFETIYSPMLESVIQNVWKQTIHNGGTIQSKYEASRKKYDEALESLDQWFGLGA